MDTKQYWKRSKATKNSSSSSSLEDENKQQQQVGDTNEVVEIPTAEPIPIPTNPIRIPAHHTSFNPSTLISVDGDTNIMSEADISNHRNNFYQKLLGIPASEVETYTPKVSQANLRSKAQLDILQDIASDHCQTTAIHVCSIFIGKTVRLCWRRSHLFCIFVVAKRKYHE